MHRFSSQTVLWSTRYAMKDEPVMSASTAAFSYTLKQTSRIPERRASAMSRPAPGFNGSDYNLLFGTLAVQMDFITKEALVAGMAAWVMDKTKSLGQILVDQGVLAPSRHALLEALVQEHLAQHADDVTKSLAALPV